MKNTIEIDTTENPAIALAKVKEETLLAYLKECLEECSFADILGAYRLLVKEHYQKKNKEEVSIDLCELEAKIRYNETPSKEQ